MQILQRLLRQVGSLTLTISYLSKRYIILFMMIVSVYVVLTTALVVDKHGKLDESKSQNWSVCECRHNDAWLIGSI